MKTFLIKSTYEYEVEANSKEEAIEKWNENIEEDLASSNTTLINEFADSLEAKEIKEKDEEMELLNKPFPITSLCREDIIGEGYKKEEVLKIKDSVMEHISTKIGDGIMESYWIILNDMLEDMGYEKKSDERFCVKCGKTSGLLEDEDICFTCAKERGRI